MADDATLKSGDEQDASIDPDRAPTQIFDVTADLNISPINPDTIDTLATPPVVPPVPQTTTLPVRPVTPTPPIRPVPTIPPPPSVAPVAPIAPAPPISPLPKPTPVSIPSTPPAPIPSPSQSAPITSYSSIPEAEKTLPGNSVIRTYEGDVASVMAKKGTSTADMAIAENKRESGQDNVLTNSEPSHAGRKSVIASISLLLIVIGLVGAYYLYSLSPLAPSPQVAQQPTNVASLIPSDSQVTLAIDGLSANQVISKIQNEIFKPQPNGSIREIIPFTTDTNGVKTRVTARQMITLFDIPAPDMLVRSLTTSWMLGVYGNEQGNKSVFVVVSNNFFQNAFAGMLSWENVMPDDLKQYLYSVVPAGVANAPALASSTVAAYVDTLQNFGSILPMTATGSSTASSTKVSTSTTASSTAATSTTTIKTTPVIPYFTLRGQFQDKIIKNKDVREFITVDGKTLFLYSFVDNAKLVLTTNEATLGEIITRLEKETFVR